MEDNEHPMSASFNAKKSKRVSLSVHGNSAPNLHTDPPTTSSGNDVMDQATLKLANMRYSQRSMSIARELGMSICRDSMHSHLSLAPASFEERGKYLALPSSFRFHSSLYSFCCHALRWEINRCLNRNRFIASDFTSAAAASLVLWPKRMPSRGHHH